MGALVAGKLGTMWEINAQIARAHPLPFSIYLGLLAGFVLAGVVLIWRDQARGAFWCAVAAILAAFFFSWGDDSFTHVYRTAALAEQIRSGAVR